MALHKNGNERVELVLSKLGIDAGKADSVVIDCNVNEPLKIYLTYFGGEELLEVRPPEANEVVIIQK